MEKRRKRIEDHDSCEAISLKHLKPGLCFLSKTQDDMERKETPKALRSGDGFHQLFSSSPVRLTIWRQSLLFHGNGYTVYDDSNGTMVFRVDNYGYKWREETFLMDYAGNVLFTIRRCKKVIHAIFSHNSLSLNIIFCMTPR